MQPKPCTTAAALLGNGCRKRPKNHGENAPKLTGCSGGERGTKTTTYILASKPPPRTSGRGGDGGLVGVEDSKSILQPIGKRRRLRCVRVDLALPDGVDVIGILSPLSKSDEQLAGMLMVFCVLWQGRNKQARTIRLSKKHALRFISDSCIGRGRNPVTVVCEALGCRLLEAGSNLHGKITNIWSYPPGADGGTIKKTALLTESQAKRWLARGKILRECQEASKPAVGVVREVLARTTESERFKELVTALTAKGEIQAVANWRKRPQNVRVTRDGDVLHPVARLPAALRRELLIDGLPVVELDVGSAHAVLLGMFYMNETGQDWIEERSRFIAEAHAGFPALYGDKKQHKRGFLSALNQSPAAARHASHGYAELERHFPLLGVKLAWKRIERPKELGAILRSRLAEIMGEAVLENYRTGVPSIPVVDSVLVPTFCDVLECVRRLSLPLAQLSGIVPVVCASDGGGSPIDRANSRDT